MGNKNNSYKNNEIIDEKCKNKLSTKIENNNNNENLKFHSSHESPSNDMKEKVNDDKKVNSKTINYFENKELQEDNIIIDFNQINKEKDINIEFKTKFEFKKK